MFFGFWGRGRKRREEEKERKRKEAEAFIQKAKDEAAFEKWRRESDLQREQAAYLDSLNVSSLDARRQRMQARLDEARRERVEASAASDSDDAAAYSFVQSLQTSYSNPSSWDSSSSDSSSSDCSSDSSSSSSDSGSCGGSD